jgi:hypothetical protein
MSIPRAIRFNFRAGPNKAKKNPYQNPIFSQSATRLPLRGISSAAGKKIGYGYIL